MEIETPQFGKKEQGVEYISRSGVYAIITSPQGNFAVVEVKDKYFLLGGGLDPGESEEEGLHREIMEEVGKKFSSSSFVGRANEYVDARDGHFNKMMSFYKVELIEDANVNPHSDPTHILRWVTKEEFRSRARHEAQIHAVENLLN
jgi:8-oxo-dGTP diphosphatase